MAGKLGRSKKTEELKSDNEWRGKKLERKLRKWTGNQKSTNE